MGQKLSLKEDIADLRVTRVQPKDKKEREVSPRGVGAPKSRDEKRIKALKKKLREIETLLSSKEEDDMTAGQLQKVECLDAVIEELENLSSVQIKSDRKNYI